MALLLRRHGILAEFAPVSAFVGEPPAADVCVVVTQALSPNARLALARQHAYAHTVLVTTQTAKTNAIVASAEASGVVVVSHGPPEEDGLLLRVVGPACASAAVVSLSLHLVRASGGPRSELAWADHLGDVASAIDGAGARAAAALAGRNPRALLDVAGFVAAGEDGALFDGFRHKVLEGLGRSQPPLWDTCGVAHGPLQSFYDRRATVISLERAGSPTNGELVARLERVLDSGRHTLIRLGSALPGPLALFDLDAQLDHLIVAALRAAPRDLANWPGKGRDEPLYGLGTDALQ